MMPISSLPGSRGFTLVEMLVVLGILSLLALLAAPRLNSTGVDGSRAEMVAKAREHLIDARQTALSTGEPQSIRADQIGPNVRLVSGIFSQESLTFYPDGSSSGATIAIGSREVLRVDWLSGAAHDIQ